MLKMIYDKVLGTMKKVLCYCAVVTFLFLTGCSNYGEQQIIISIDESDHVYVQQDQTTLEELGPKLKTLRNPNVNTQIFLRGDKNASYNQIMQVMNIVNAAGFTKIVLVPKPNEIGTEKTELPQLSKNKILTISEADAMRHQIEKCWNAPIGGPDTQNMIVELQVDYNPDYTVAKIDIVDKNRYSNDLFFHAFADSAMRAVRNPNCRPLELPTEKYDHWKHVIIRFDMKDILN